MSFVNIQVLPWFISYVITNIQECSLCWCVFSGLVGQINVSCNIHITFDSGLTYSSNIKCLISGFNKIFQVIKTFVKGTCIQMEQRERETERDRVWLDLIFCMSSMSQYLQLVIMFSGFLFIKCDDKSLNCLNNKLRFGCGSRFMELPVFVLLLLLLRTNELKF